MNAQNIIEVNSSNVGKLLQNFPGIIILDVRTPAEYANGHIKHAINLDANAVDAVNKIDKLDKSSKYIVHCHTHIRSGAIVNYMAQNGFKTIYQMMDGFSGWNRNGLPVEK